MFALILISVVGKISLFALAIVASGVAGYAFRGKEHAAIAGVEYNIAKEASQVSKKL
jgi:hypothetical protein